MGNCICWIAFTLICVFIIVLFVFVTMMLHQGEATLKQEAILYQPRRSLPAMVLCGILLLELICLLSPLGAELTSMNTVTVRDVGAQLYGPYLLLVELAALLLLSALVGAYHIGHRYQERKRCK